MRRLTVFGMALMLASPLSARPFQAENRVTVVSAPGGFDVQSDGGFGARGMWCAAAHYAREVSGAEGTARLYIAQGRTPGLGQRAPVRFTLDPTGLIPAPVTVVGASLRRAGSTLSVDHAYSFCADARLINR
jgi:hypothetical protein